MCIVCADLSGQFRAEPFLRDSSIVDGEARLSEARPGDGMLFFLDVDDRGGAGPNGKPSLLPVDHGAQITRSGLSWSSLGTPTTVTYSYRSNAPGTMPSDTAGFNRFSEAQIVATELTLQSWADVAGITFQRQGSGTSGEGAYSDNATIVFGNYTSGQGGAAAFAYLPGNATVGANPGDVWINSSLGYNSTPVHLAYGYQVLTHEIGHAIGLSHPAAYNASEGVTLTYSEHAQYYEDSRQYTLMSYFSESNTGGFFGGRYAAAPLMDDIAAAQRLYGANMTTRTGDTVYGFNSTADRVWYNAGSAGSPLAVVFAVWDAGGNDTLDFSGYTQASTIDLRQGHFSSVGGLTGNVSIAMGVTLENAVGGSGVDNLIGNSANNRLDGRMGADQINGGAGDDTAVYSGTQASYAITAGTEIVDGMEYRILNVVGAQGADVLRNVEFLSFSDGTVAAPTANAGIRVEGDATNDSITGTTFHDWIMGAGGADTLDGGDGDDRLDGGRGTDTLNGGAGSDTADYSSATGAVSVNLSNGAVSGAAGVDILSSIENVRGSTYGDTLTGDAGVNVLNGNGGIDTLNGGGGNDTLIAGAGATVGAPDVNKAAATINTSIEVAVNIDGNFDQMNDPGVTNATTVPHAVIRGVGSGSGQEFYAFTVTAGAACIFDIGTASFDSTLRLYDSSGNQLAFNDDEASGNTNSLINHTFTTAGTYYVAVGRWESGTSASVPSAPVPAAGTYVLNVSIPGHAYVEAAALGSTLNGGDGDDLLQGGASNDTINGGAGNDTAVFAGNRAAWTITDNGGGNFTLSNGSQTDTVSGVEFARFDDQTANLAPVTGGPTAGPDVLNGTENADTIDGLAGDDVINGLGGDDILTGSAGSDTLSGGAGSDRFVFGAAADSPYSPQRDLITDFTSASDTLQFTNPSEGRLTIARFGADSFVYFGLSGGNYTGAVRLNGAAVQAYDIMGQANGVTMYGDAANNTLTGHTGADIILGGDGADVINGAAGSDTLTGGAGADRFDISSVSHSTMSAFDVITDFTTGQDRINLGALVNAGYTSIALARFGGSTFVYFGQTGSSTFDGVVQAVGDVNGLDLATAGQTLNLQVYGSADADVLIGGNGDDTFIAGDGGDTVLGGLGADNIYGGAGGDIFVYSATAQSTTSSYDVIQDFQSGVDRVDLRLVASSVVLSEFGGATFIYFDQDQNGGYRGLIVVAGSATQDDVLVAGESAPGFDPIKDGALTLPGLADDDALVLPAEFGKDEGALTLPPLADLDDPLVLPVADAAKVFDDGAVICPPSADEMFDLGPLALIEARQAWDQLHTRDRGGVPAQAYDWAF